VAEQLSDQVRHFFTINEFRNFTDAGYRGNEIHVGGGVVRLEAGPGLQLTDAAVNQVRHHAVLGHGLAVQAIRARGQAGTQVGPADSFNIPVPLIGSPEHIKAAEIATREHNAPFLGVMLEGQYLDSYLEAAGKDAPQFTAEDLAIISSPLDFVGINIY
jgi:beta-glucosidase